MRGARVFSSLDRGQRACAGSGQILPQILATGRWSVLAGEESTPCTAQNYRLSRAWPGFNKQGAPKVGANLALAHLAYEQQAPSLASTFPQFFLQIDHCIWLMWRSVGWPWCDRSFVEFQCGPVSESLLLSKLRRSCALNLPKLDLSIFENHPWIYDPDNPSK